MIVSDPSERLQAAIDAEAWPAVAQLLAGSLEPGDLWLRTLALNLDALRTHRATVYTLIRDAILSGEVEIEGATVRAPGSDSAAVQAFHAIAMVRRSARSFAFAGMRDGTMLRAMAKFPPCLALGRQQEVMLLEPDLGKLISGLGCCDLTGRRGPIEQERIGWYVGPGWDETLLADLAADATMALPLRSSAVSEIRPEIDLAMVEVERRLEETRAARQADANDYYANLTDEELLSVFGSNPPRQPRVLMLTSKFTSVLQYSTLDSADAMRQLGWDVRVVNETTLWHQMAKPAVSAAIADFKPDLVFQIDHLRYELGDEIVPPRVPFVCWIQDHFANLTDPSVGATIGKRDFVLTGGTYRYVARQGYPRAQCIDMPKVSRKPENAVCLDETGSRHGGEDLIYVSHWSSTPEEIIIEVCQRVGEIANADCELLMRACATELTRIYADGGSVRLHAQIRQLVRDMAARHQFATLPADTERFFVETLFERLNNAFYRQQSLLWASEIADELGLTLGIYGRGWDRHPILRKHARGPVKYGADLENITRRSTMLLQLEPYACYSHQRMLDALLAGGFALVRTHEYNRVPLKVRDFLDAHVPAEVNSVEDAFASLDSESLREQFEAVLAEAAPISAMGDIVDVVRGWQRAGTIGDEAEALPHLSEIEFDTKAELLARIRRFMNAPNDRRAIADAQRTRVEARLTYVAALGRAVREMHDRLARHFLETPSDETVCTAFREAA